MNSTQDLVDLQLGIYIQVACLSLLVYDTLLNIDRELNYIWRSRWSLVKCLYLWARYAAVLDTAFAVTKHFVLGVSPTGCARMIFFDNVFAALGIAFAEVILMIRTYALYKKSRKILVFFILMWICLVVTNVWPVLQWARSKALAADTSLPSPLPSCDSTESSSNIVLVVYISLLCMETVIVLLTVWKGLKLFWNGSFQPRRYSDLVTTFYLDGMFWYLGMLVILVVNVFLQTTAQQPAIRSIANTPMGVLHSVFACRLVIHVRHVAVEEREFGCLVRKAI
ncbi:hypothetical protein FB45DRAFT_38968 [Roridomyces roridus]|uniref:DUF6533 domain-containing protein n=1 Tax=Roridomyces roridus TaxID=1738132 RepID=A0AAD7BRL0_9AGAR|nr:hypothetical protein FB45DRAFT_38968 [Roridomyces roridus]